MLSPAPHRPRGRWPRAAGDDRTRAPITLVAPLVAPLRAAQAGGAQTAVCELAAGLLAAGLAVDLVAAPGSRVPGIRVTPAAGGPFPEALLALPGPADSGGAGAAWPSLQAPTYLRLAGRLTRRRPVLVHSHAHDWPAFYALAATGLPTVHTLHLGPVDPATVAAAIAARSCRPRPRLVAVSRACARAWLPHLRVDAVIGNGLDPADVPFRARPEADLAVIAGRISPEKGVHLALDAIRRAGMRAQVAGPVYDPVYHREQVVPRLDGVGARHLGPLPRRRLLALLGRAAVVVVASLWEEPFGLVALEANLAGTPVAGLRRGGLPEVVGAWGGVLTDVARPGALAGAIRAATALDRVSVRGGAARHHSRVAMVERYRRLYAALAEDPL